MTTFLDLGVSRALVDTLERRDILAPFEIQSLVLRDALAGSDVLARSQTGSGKTLAFAIPIVQRLEPGDGRRPAALVLVPTRELAVQVADRAVERRGEEHRLTLRRQSAHDLVDLRMEAHVEHPIGLVHD